MGDDLLAKKPATHPITKHPRTFTESVPKGIKFETLLGVGVSLGAVIFCGVLVIVFIWRCIY